MPTRDHIAGLDGLRALACLAVFGVHLQQQTNLGGAVGPFDLHLLLENGNVGVCLFFMLSAFLLSLPFWKSDQHPPIPTPGRHWALTFALRRVARIVPAYYACLLVLLLAGRAQSVADAAMHLTFTHNFSDDTFYSISSPFWTLAVQAQFYVLFPLLIMIPWLLTASAAARATLLAIAAALAFIAHVGVMRLIAPPPSSAVLSHSLLAFLPHFLLGMCAAVLHVTLPQPKTAAARLLLDALCLAAFILIFCILGIPALDARFRIPAGVTDDRLMLGRYNFPYIPLLIAFLLLAAPRGKIVTALLESPPFRNLGVISFGIYVFHLPCIMLTAEILHQLDIDARTNWLTLALSSLVLSILVATLSYHLLEKPLLARLSGRPRKQKQRVRVRVS